MMTFGNARLAVVKVISRLIFLVVIGASGRALHAEEWVPARIVAIAQYAPLASAASVHGDVVIKCFLDDTGSVIRAEAISGPALLKEQARQNASLWDLSGHPKTGQ